MKQKKHETEKNKQVNDESIEKTILDSNVESCEDSGEKLKVESNPFEKWGLRSVCAYLEDTGRDNEIWDIIDNNEEIMQMPPNERFKHRILVGGELACRLLDVSNERNENDEDYYQMYELSLWGDVWDFSKFGLDALIKKYPKAVEELNNEPSDLGLFVHAFMNKYINHYYPYSKCRNHYIS